MRGRGATAGSESAAGVEGAEISGPYSHLHFAKDGRPRPPSRRRPLSSTGAGGVEARRGALTAPRLTPARVTQSTTRSKSKTGSGEYVYFFFRRFVLRAPFFAADFVFVLRFFAMLPS